MPADRYLRFWATLLHTCAPPLAIAVALIGPVHAEEVSLTQRLEKLQQAYPDYIVSIDEQRVTMRDKTTFEIDDGQKEKSFDQKLAHPDIEDMLSQIYPVGCAVSGRAAPDFDPGRIRNEDFFKSIYGASASEVTANLVKVDWYGQTLLVNKTLGVDKQLAKVAKDLEPSLESLRDYLIPSAGTFNWRPIAGTSRLSTHSYGIAIDISTAKSDYWRWAKGAPEKMGAPTHKVSEEIIAAFEKHGFIWGGNWYHYDTMHFEYRPELIEIGKTAGSRGCAQ